MRGLLGALAFAIAALVAFSGAGTAMAADPVIAVTLDQRPIDRSGGIAVVRGGAIYIDVIDITRAFGGLMLFSKGSVRVNIGGASANFIVGRRSAQMRGTSVLLPAAPFVRNGDIYVPLKQIVELAGGQLAYDKRKGVANVTSPAGVSRLNSFATPTISPITALALKSSAEAQPDGLHLSLTVTNVSSAPYTLEFASGARVAFIVSKDGTVVWNSAEALRYTESKGSEVLPAGASRTYNAVWSGYAQSGPGRYLLRATLLSSTPVHAAPQSVGVVSASPT